MNDPHAAKVTLTHKLHHELRQLVAIFIYLSIFFLALRVYTKLILVEFQVHYFQYGLTLLKSLALAKVILTGEALRLGERYRHRPLIVPTVYKTVVFSVFALCFEVIEHLILGWIHGKGASEVWSEMMEKGVPHFTAMALVVFVAFLPFFAFRELEQVIGVRRLREIFFKDRFAAAALEKQIGP